MNRLIEPSEKSNVELLLRKLHATIKRSQLEKKFESKSPYAVTSQTPTSRLVDNAITKGSWRTSPINTSAQHGIFGKMRIVRVGGGESNGSIDTTVQFDEIFMCPVTGREFLKKDLDDYKKGLENELRHYVDGMVYTSQFEVQPLKDEARIATDGMVFEISVSSIDKLLDVELQGIEFIKEIKKYKVEVES